jgi:hypothetical protein
MTLAELCFIIAVAAFVVDALPLIKLAFPFKLTSAGQALVAIGLALGAGLAVRLGVEGTIL